MYFGHGTYSPSDLDLIKIQKTKNGETKEYYRVYDINSSEINIEVSIETAEIDVVDSVLTDNIADWSEKREQIYEDMNFVDISDSDVVVDSINISKLPMCEGDARAIALKLYNEKYGLNELTDYDLYSELVDTEDSGQEVWYVYHYDESGEIAENSMQFSTKTALLTKIDEMVVSKEDCNSIYNTYNISISTTNRVVYFKTPLSENDAKQICIMMNKRFGYDISKDQILCYDTIRTIDITDYDCYFVLAPDAIQTSFWIEKSTGYISQYPGGVDFHSYEYIGYHIIKNGTDTEDDEEYAKKIHITNLPLSELDARKIAKEAFKVIYSKEYEETDFTMVDIDIAYEKKKVWLAYNSSNRSETVEIDVSNGEIYKVGNKYTSFSEEIRQEYGIGTNPTQEILDIYIFKNWETTREQIYSNIVIEATDTNTYMFMSLTKEDATILFNNLEINYFNQETPTSEPEIFVIGNNQSYYISGHNDTARIEIETGQITVVNSEYIRNMTEQEKEKIYNAVYKDVVIVQNYTYKNVDDITYQLAPLSKDYALELFFKAYKACLSEVYTVDDINMGGTYYIERNNVYEWNIKTNTSPVRTAEIETATGIFARFNGKITDNVENWTEHLQEIYEDNIMFI